MRMCGTRLNEMNAGTAHERIKNQFFCFYLRRQSQKKSCQMATLYCELLVQSVKTYI